MVWRKLVSTDLSWFYCALSASSCGIAAEAEVRSSDVVPSRPTSTWSYPGVEDFEFRDLHGEDRHVEDPVYHRRR